MLTQKPVSEQRRVTKVQKSLSEQRRVTKVQKSLSVQKPITKAQQSSFSNGAKFSTAQKRALIEHTVQPTRFQNLQRAFVKDIEEGVASLEPMFKKSR